MEFKKIDLTWVECKFEFDNSLICEFREFILYLISENNIESVA